MHSFILVLTTSDDVADISGQLERWKHGIREHQCVQGIANVACSAAAKSCLSMGRHEGKLSFTPKFITARLICRSRSFSVEILSVRLSFFLSMARNASFHALISLEMIHHFQKPSIFTLNGQNARNVMPNSHYRHGQDSWLSSLVLSWRWCEQNWR